MACHKAAAFVNINFDETRRETMAWQQVYCLPCKYAILAKFITNSTDINWVPIHWNCTYDMYYAFDDIN